MELLTEQPRKKEKIVVLIAGDKMLSPAYFIVKMEIKVNKNRKNW